MDSDESYHSESMTFKHENMTFPVFLNSFSYLLKKEFRGMRPRAVLETSGTVFPNTDRPRPVNNIYILIFHYNTFIP